MGIAAGTRFGRYEIESLLGAGGMGEVYRAADTTLGRPVAIKVLPATFAEDPKRLRRFEQEARAASSLNHPNIFTIYDVGTHNGMPYVVSELLVGETLRQRIKKSRLSIRRALDYGWQVANGIAAAHQKGILHRDLKPENIFITTSGTVKVLDFGLAKLIEHKRESADPEASTEVIFDTEPGTAVGTIYYMSPEQLQGGRVDKAADVFSFGLVFYETLVGKHPVSGETPFAVAAAILSREEIDIDGLGPNLPLEIRRFLKRTLIKNPKDRCSSFEELKRELKKLRRDIVRRAGAIDQGASTVSAVAATESRVDSSVADTAAVLDESKQSRASIFVLPLETLGASQEDSYIGVGLAYALTTDLAKIDGLSVLSRSPVNPAKEKPADGGRQLAAELGAKILLEGEVMREGQTIRVLARLIDVETGRVVWGGRYRDDASKLFNIHDLVCEGVAAALRVNLSGRLPSGDPPAPFANLDAFEFYSKGRAFLERYYVRENVDFAIGMFEQAIALNSGLALAFAGLSEAYWRKYQATHDKSWVPRAIAAGDQALILDPLQGQVHVSLGILYYGTGKIPRAIEEFSHAIDLQPMDAEAYSWLGRCYAQTGDMDRAVSYFAKAIETRPGYWDSYNNLGICYYNFGRYDDAAEQFRRVITIQPDNFHGYNNLGGLYCLLGRYEDALLMHTRAVEIHPDANVYTNLGTDLYYLCRYEEAREAYDRAVMLDPADDIHRRNLGDALLRLERADEARQQFEEARRLILNHLEVTPGDAQLLGRLAICEAKLESRDAAVAHLKSAIELEPGNTTLMYQGAVVYTLTDHTSDALDSLARALSSGYSRSEAELDPDLEELRKQPEYKTVVGSGLSR